MKKVFILLNFTLLISCIYTQDRFEERVFYVSFNQALIDYDDDLVLRGGEISILILNKPEKKVIYKLHFHTVKGGTTYFLGKKKIKEVHAYKDKRFSITIKDQPKIDYSINDLKAMNTEKIDTFNVISIPL